MEDGRAEGTRQVLIVVLGSTSSSNPVVSGCPGGVGAGAASTVMAMMVGNVGY